jgi:myosin heavy subunit
MSHPPWIIPGIKCWYISSQPQQKEDINFIPATILSIKNDSQIILQTDDALKIETDFINIKEANQIKNENGFKDLVEMEILNEAEILWNLKLRFKNNEIFTYIGPTLIVMNPYKEIKGIFEKEIILNFMEKKDEKNRFPHIYQIALNAISQLSLEDKSQAIVISGESGAGKTESAKYAMK